MTCHNDTVTLEHFQATFDAEPGYLDWAAFGPLSATVRGEVHADAELLGSGRRSGIELVNEHLGRARDLLAGLLGARADEVVLQPSVSQGLMHALFGLSGNLLVGRREFAALTVAARRAEQNGAARVTWLDPEDGRITADAVARAVTADTTALAVSLVDFRTGYRVDLPALRDALGDDRLLILDAAHAFGVIEADFAAADVVCGHGNTWLRAGRGTGFARFSDRARERIEPVLSGMDGAEHDPWAETEPEPAAAAGAYMTSAPDPLAGARLAASLREVADLGIETIEREIAERTRDVIFLADRYEIPVVTPREPARRAGIVTLAPAPGSLAPLSASLANHGLTFTARGDLLRISPHVGTEVATLRLLGDAFAASRSW